MSLRKRLAGLFGAKQLDRELDEELRAHIDMRAEELIAAGVTPTEAHRQAVVAFGNHARTKEDTRASDTLQWLESLLQDVRYGLRQLRRNVGFTAVAVCTLALGIGATSLIFSVVYTVLLRPLPFADPDRIVAAYVTSQQAGTTQTSSGSYPDFLDWRSQSTSFEAMSTMYRDSFTLIGAGEPAHLSGEVVSGDFFRVLRTEPAIGRGFTRDDEKPGNHVVVLSDASWRRFFHADPAIVGHSVRLDDNTFTVIGVMPPGFSFPPDDKADLWMTFAIEAEGTSPQIGQRGVHYLDVVGRLKPGVSVEAAQADLSRIEQNLARLYPNNDGSYTGVRVVSELAQITSSTRPGLLILMAGVCCLLLIACANVANLLLAKGTGRAGEVAVRAALGASRGRVARQLLTETSVLWLLGGVVGTCLAWIAQKGIVSLARNEVPRIASLHLDAGIVAGTLAVSLLTGLVFGLAPVLPLLRKQSGDDLKLAGRGAGQSRQTHRIRSVLVVAEVAIALVLLVSASLLGNSYWRLQRVDPGFRSDGILSFSTLIPQRFSNPADPKDRRPRAQFYRDLLPKLSAIPGVDGAAGALPLPLSGNDLNGSFKIEGRPTDQAHEPSATFFIVSPNFLNVMKVPLLRGRMFNERDDFDAPPVAIVSASFAKQFFPGEDAIGKRFEPEIATGNSRERMREIVGVVPDIKLQSLRDEPDPQYYLPYEQLPIGGLTLVVHAQVDAASLAPQVSAAVHAVDAETPVYNLHTMDELMERSLATMRFNMVLLMSFASAALLLTIVGLYGVIAYAVAQRTREMGIRVALGANRRQLTRMMLRNGAQLAVIGSAIGVVVALAVTRFLSQLLYGVRPLDPSTFVASTAMLSLIALAAAYIPARRASRVDPITALRQE